MIGQSLGKGTTGPGTHSDLLGHTNPIECQVEGVSDVVVQDTARKLITPVQPLRLSQEGPIDRLAQIALDVDHTSQLPGLYEGPCALESGMEKLNKVRAEQDPFCRRATV